MSRNDVTELPLAVPIPTQPCQQLYSGNPVLLGYDVVQYHFIPPFREGGIAVRGSPQYAYNFAGYQFWFSSQENRDLFVQDPWKYAPAYGGFCAWGVARETQAWWPWEYNRLGPPASPWEGWVVYNGTLYFNIWASYSDRFLEQVEEHIHLANQRWKQTWFLKSGQDSASSQENAGRQVGPFNTHCIGHGPMENWCIAPQPSPWMERLPSCTYEVTEENETSLKTLSMTQEEYEDARHACLARTTTTTSSGNETNFNETLDCPFDQGFANVTVKVQGGGIVNPLVRLEDFDRSKSSLSPESRKKRGIVGGVVGGLIGLGVIVLGVRCVMRKRRRSY